MIETTNPLQRFAYANPIYEAGQADRPEYFRRYDDRYAVGLSVNK